MRRIGAFVGLRAVLILGLAICGVVALLLAGCAGQATQTTVTTAGGGVTSTTELSATQSTGPTGSSSSTTVATEETTTSEAAVQPEDSPPGDIPDNQAFVVYKPPVGFTIKYPEGWARVESGSTTSFTDKLNTIVLSWSNATAAPTEASVQSTDVPALQQAGRAFELGKVSTVKVPAGHAVLVTYRINGDPNPVTGKQYRLDVLRYSLFNNGLRVDVTLLAPVGADNVDPWNIVIKSLTWT